MPPKATRGSQKKPAKGRKRSSNVDIEQQTADSMASQPSADFAAAAMSDEGDEETQSSSDAAATPLSKKAKLAPAALTAASAAAASAPASSSSAAAAASSAPSPCARLDLDSLSVVFSLLNMRDFLHAVRVSRHWRSARTKRTAWPAFSLETMIQQLRDDDFDNPQRRKFEVAVKSGNKTKLAALINQPGVMELWRHVTEIKLVHQRLGSNKEVAASTAMMSLLPQFASLVALTLDGFVVAPDADSAVAELFGALSPRLQMLGLFRCFWTFAAHLHRLSSLRVLVLGWIPEADALVQLHQLVYLHVERNRNRETFASPPKLPRLDARLGLVIRWLSVHHQLRSLSVEGFKDDADSFANALMSCDPPSAADSETLADLNRTLHPPLDPAVPCALSDLSLNHLATASKSLLGGLPSLTRLQCFAQSRSFWGDHPGLFDVDLDTSLQRTLPRLQQLRMEVDFRFADWHHLARCTALRTVHLSQAESGWGSLTRPMLQSLLRAWSATIEECSLQLEMTLEGEGPDSGNSEWIELAVCHRLRALELKLEKGQSLPAGLIAALPDLPTFQSLTVSWEGTAMCPLPSNLLSVMCRSQSFSTLHLHALSAGSRAPDFVQSADAAVEGRGLTAVLSALDPSLLQPATLDRFRVLGSTAASPSSVRCFRIQLELGQATWQREY